MDLYSFALSALMSDAMPVCYEDRGQEFAIQKQEQYRILAQAYAEAAELKLNWPLGKRERVAALLATSHAETSNCMRFHAGNCKPKTWECDWGQARGPFQAHESSLSDKSNWDKLTGITLENTRIAAREAAQTLAYRWQLCRGTDDEIRGMFNAYGGRSCKASWKSSQERVEHYRKILALPLPISPTTGFLLVGDSQAEGLEHPLRNILEDHDAVVTDWWARGTSARYWRRQSHRFSGVGAVLISVGTNDCLSRELRQDLAKNVREIANSSPRVVFLKPPRGCQELDGALEGFESLNPPELTLRDNVHPTKDAYTVWADYIAKYLMSSKE